MRIILYLKHIFISCVVAAPLCLSVSAQKEASFADLDRIVGNATYVNFGEDSHRMTGEHQYVARIFRHLAETKKFRVLVFEAAWGTEEAFADFMSSDRTTVTPEESFYLNAFNSKAIVEMLIWMRDWNRKNPNDKIRITGFQPEQPVTDFNALSDLARKSDKFAAADLKAKAAVCRAGTGEFKKNVEFIGSTGKRLRSGRPIYTTEERAACNQAIDTIEGFIEQNKKELVTKNSQNAYLEAAAHLISLRTYLNTLTVYADQTVINKNSTPEEKQAAEHTVYQGGDKARFEIFQILNQTRFKNQKVFFWMHNWHAMKHAEEVGGLIPEGTTSVGTRLAQAFGKRMAVIGSIVPKVICSDPNNTRCAVPAPRPDLLETKFAEFFGPGNALVDLRKPKQNEKILPISVLGSLYADFHKAYLTNVILKRQFDAIYYLSETGGVFDEK